MIKTSALAGVVLCAALCNAGEAPLEPSVFFREQMGLNDDEIAMIGRGQAVAKVLPSRIAAEIIVFGAVFVKARPEEYVRLAFDMGRLRRMPGYLGAVRFGDPPLLSDLDGFTLEPDDIRNLKNCRPGKCAVQLPAEAMHELQKALDWSGPNVATHVNERMRKMAFEVLQRYQEDGNRVLGSYRDSKSPFDVDAQLQSLVGRSKALPVYLPELDRYLLDYPNAALTNVEASFYWEKVTFGLKPTLRLNHAIAYRSEGARGVAQVVAVKQLYASHYFQLALDLTACVTERGRTSEPGFYLISLRGSTQQGLTGLLGALRRRIIVSRTRSAQETALINIKKALETER